ncbi:MAG: cupin domain-containing protein [Saprospiraceae bacterium]|jgi:quercetin dioxygenase-like cupin family protein|nr:cupin domain-containing protein [Saprospiraceae bacterium]
MSSITLKSTGETITFVKTSKDTEGAFTEIICTIPAGQKGPPPHIHPLQDEIFEVIEGQLELLAKGKKIILEQGQSFNVTAKMAHTFSNPFDKETKIRATYKPALNIDYILVQGFESLNSQSNPDKPSFQMIVDFDFILKQIHGQYKFAGASGYIFMIFAAIARLFIKPKVKTLKDHNASF